MDSVIDYWGWVAPDGKMISVKTVPELNMNILFKYAVPKLSGEVSVVIAKHGDVYECI